MVSLTVIASLFAGQLLLSGCVFSFLARRLGSERGRLRIGLAAAGVLMVVNVVLLALALPFAGRPTLAVAVACGLVLAQAIAAVAVLRGIYRLPLARTLILFAAYVVLAVDESVLTAFVIRPYLIESFVISSRSMAPTLDPGDCITVNKVTPPRRWDLVAYWTADEPPTIYCSRVVGLPGERLRFQDGTLYVDDAPMAPPPVVAGRYHASPAGVPPAYIRYRDGETIELGDEFFVIGDNVDRSVDARLRGPSDRSSLVGVADLQYWPLGKLKVLR